MTAPATITLVSTLREDGSRFLQPKESLVVHNVIWSWVIEPGRELASALAEGLDILLECFTRNNPDFPFHSYKIEPGSRLDAPELTIHFTN